MDILFETLKDKKKLISFLLKTIEESDKSINGLSNLSSSLTRSEPNHSIENIAKCTAVALTISAKQQDTIKTLATIALIQCSSNDFDVDIAKLLNKLGRGEEALRQMMDNKFKER